MFKGFFLRRAELFWHLEKLFVLFLFAYLFVMLLLGAGSGEARGFKIHQGIAKSQETSGAGKSLIAKLRVQK